MGGEYNRQLLTNEAAKRDLEEMKALLSKSSANTVTFSEVITEFVGKAVKFMGLPQPIKSYITAFAGIVSKYPDVCGMMLFGSVAKNTYDKDSDIDMLVIVDDKKINAYNLVNDAKMQVEDLRAGFLENGYHLRISTTILEKTELKIFRPIYFDLLSYGIVLYEKNAALTNFLNEVRGIWHKRILTENGEVLKWKTKQERR